MHKKEKINVWYDNFKNRIYLDEKNVRDFKLKKFDIFNDNKIKYVWW